MFPIRKHYNAPTEMGEPEIGARYRGYSPVSFPTIDPQTEQPITEDRAAETGLPMIHVSYAIKRTATYTGHDTFFDDDKSTRFSGRDPRVDMSVYEFLIKSDH